MPACFLYDESDVYFEGQDVAADARYAMMRHAGVPDIGDAYLSFSYVMRPSFSDRTRRWGGWGMAKPKNSKPRRKEHRA